MERIVKEFVCITKTENRETTSYYQAVVKCEYEKPFRLIVKSQEYLNGTRSSKTETEIYFSNKKEMLEAYKFQYIICKENYNTNFIKRTIE